MTLTAGGEGKLRSSYGTPLSPSLNAISGGIVYGGDGDNREDHVDRKQARAFEGFDDQTFENPKTGAVLETAFVYQDGTTGTDLYLSVTSRDTVPPNPYRR
jgi:hypothetical protein